MLQIDSRNWEPKLESGVEWRWKGLCVCVCSFSGKWPPLGYSMWLINAKCAAVLQPRCLCFIFCVAINVVIKIATAHLPLKPRFKICISSSGFSSFFKFLLPPLVFSLLMLRLLAVLCESVCKMEVAGLAGSSYICYTARPFPFIFLFFWLAFSSPPPHVLISS